MESWNLVTLGIVHSQYCPQSCANLMRNRGVSPARIIVIIVKKSVLNVPHPRKRTAHAMKLAGRNRHELYIILSALWN